MNIVSRTISGMVILALGIFVVYGTLVEESGVWSFVSGLSSGVFLCGVAVYLFLNTKEDKIEQIKYKEK